MLIFSETICLDADTPLSVLAHRWNLRAPRLATISGGKAPTLERASSNSSSMVCTPGFL